MRVLVIGGAGVTGTPIVNGLLKRHCEITVLGRGQRALPFGDKVKTLIADPYAKDSIVPALAGKQFDVAIATYGRLRYVAQGLTGHTTRLISVGGAAPIYTGWGEMTSPNPWETTQPTPLLLSEDHALASAPTEDRFAQMVRKTEEEVMQLHAAGVFNVTHLRYPLVYGPNNICPAEWCLVRRANEQRRPLITPAGSLTIVSRGFADNMAHAILLAVENPEASAGQIYNLRDDQLLHNHEWVTRVGDLLKHRFDMIDIPFSQLPSGFRAAPPQLLYRHHGLPSIDKIKQQLGYRDIVSVEEALERTVHFYLRHPVAAGSEAEQNLGDPFDYDYEDALIAAWQNHCHDFVQDLAKLPAPKVIWKHPYQRANP